jgi:hypothetical protein
VITLAPPAPRGRAFAFPRKRRPPARCAPPWGPMADRSIAQDTVCLAVGLGWLLVELYDSRRLPGPPPDDDERPLPPHLPGIGAMTPYEKACALAAHVGADLARLEAALGLGMLTAKSIQAVLDTPVTPVTTSAGRSTTCTSISGTGWPGPIPPPRSPSAWPDAGRRGRGRSHRLGGAYLTSGPCWGGRSGRPSTPCGTPRWSRPSGRRPLSSRAMTNPDQRPPSSPMRAWPRGHERRLACRG